MSKQTITPGEWASQCQTYQDWIVYAKDPSYSVVCKILGGGFVDEKARANAQAIAAVPDMIEALQLIHQCLGYMKENHLGSMTPAMLEALDSTITALRKAGQID